MKHQRDNSTVYLIDCLEYMKTIPDKYYNLALVDPPYGIGAGCGVGLHSRKKYQKSGKSWDNAVPTKEYWDEIFRVSKNQIVCGANYFIQYLYASKSFICWIKNNPAPNFAQAEIIWTSFDINGKVYNSNTQIQHEIMWDGGSIHPTQKPIALYDWIYKNYLPNGGKVFDSHLGSQSNRISAFKRGNIIFDACELDVDYFNDGNDRYDEFLMKYQPAELNPITKQGQTKLF